MFQCSLQTQQYLSTVATFWNMSKRLNDIVAVLTIGIPQQNDDKWLWWHRNIRSLLCTMVRPKLFHWQLSAFWTMFPKVWMKLFFPQNWAWVTVLVSLSLATCKSRRIMCLQRPYINWYLLTIGYDHSTPNCLYLRYVL